MARKPNWKRRGITREQAIAHSKRVDHAYDQLSRRGSIRREEFQRMIQGEIPLDK